MSHYHAELIFPETTDIRGAVEKLMRPFDENSDEEGGGRSFWDFWVIGGRFSGAKLTAKIGKDRMQGFYDALNARKVTVSSIQCGKQELSPASQIPMVDALWSEMFPEFKGACPIFSHYNDQYGQDNAILPVDVCTVSVIPDALECSTLIIGGGDDDERAVTLLHTSIWNGVVHQDTAFSGNVLEGLRQHNNRIADYTKDYAEKVTVRGNWLAVTVDYHS